MTDLTKFNGGSPFTVDALQETRNPLEQLRDAMAEQGLEAPSHIATDGKVHRFSTSGNNRDDAGWYVIYSDPILAGSFGCWRTGLKCDWHETGRNMSLAESMACKQKMQDAKEKAQAERAQKAEAASCVVSAIWEDAKQAPAEHGYLESHGIGAHGARLNSDGRLIIPAFAWVDSELKLASAQYIAPDGAKRFHTSGAMGGAIWWLGDIRNATEGVYVAEGFATAAAVREATGKPVVVSFSAHNLPNAAKIVRAIHGASCQIVIVADNDKSGTGQFYANQAVATHGGRVVMPPDLGQDACDFRLAGGNLMELLEPKSSGWLVHGSELVSQPAPIKWLLKHWMPRESMGMLHGESGIGKSFLMLDACLAIATRRPDWHGKKVSGGTVVYLAGEGHNGMRARVASWVKEKGVDPSLLDIWVSREGCDLDTPEGLSRVQSELLALPQAPALIVVDTLHRFMSGDENHQQDARKMIQACDRLKVDFGATVVWVHHRSKAADGRARGSSAFKGALDFEIGLGRDAQDSVRVDCMKMKDQPEPEPFWFELQAVDLGWVDEDGEAFHGAVAVPCAKPDVEERDKETDDGLKLIERAWWSTGTEVAGGDPYVSRSAFKSFLINDLGYSESKAKNATRTEPRRLIGGLLESGAITETGHGWTVTDDATRAVLLVTMNGS